MYKVDVLKTSRGVWTNYCYLVVDLSSGQGALVDPAWELKVILRKIEEEAVQLSKVLLTHSHYDHTHLAKPLVSHFGCEVLMGAKEIEASGFSCPNLTGVEDKEEIWIGRTRVKCLLTPGHTAGGMCFLLGKSLFSGDTLFAEGCGICTDKGGDAGEMFESIQRIKKDTPEHVRVYPGHSYGKTPGQTLQSLFSENIYLQIEEKAYFTRFRMRKGQQGLFNFK